MTSQQDIVNAAMIQSIFSSSKPEEKGGYLTMIMVSQFINTIILVTIVIIMFYNKSSPNVTGVEMMSIQPPQNMMLQHQPRANVQQLPYYNY